MCPWYFTFKRLISERPNLVPVGLGNNTVDYDVSILLGQGNDEVNPANRGANPSDSDEPKGNPDDQEIEDGQSLPGAKATVKAKVAIKKKSAVPSKWTRSQVDRIADTEIARLECKKTKFETEQQRLRTLASVASVKAQERSRRMVDIREAELNNEREKMRLDHEYRLELLKHGQFTPSSQDSHHLTPPHNFQPPWPTQSYNMPQPSVDFKPQTALERFPLPPSEHTDDNQGGDPVLGSGLFDGATY